MPSAGTLFLPLFDMRSCTLALALLTGLTGPARAVWDEIGQIDVHDQGERFMRDLPVKGPIETIRLVAAGSDIFCRSIQETFSGGTRDLFQGLLHDGGPVDINLHGTGGSIQMLTFQCGALVRGEASIHVFVNLG